MSLKCCNNNNNNNNKCNKKKNHSSDNPLTSRRTDGGKNMELKPNKKADNEVEKRPSQLYERMLLQLRH